MLVVVLVKEVLKAVGYGVLHHRFTGIMRRLATQGSDPSLHAELDWCMRRMSWYSRSWLMAPYCLWWGWDEALLLYQLEYDVRGGKAKVFVVDLVLQDLPQLAYTALAFAASASWATLDASTTRINITSFSVTALFILLNLLSFLRYWCCTYRQLPAEQRSLPPHMKPPQPLPVVAYIHSGDTPATATRVGVAWAMRPERPKPAEPVEISCPWCQTPMEKTALALHLARPLYQCNDCQGFIASCLASAHQCVPVPSAPPAE